MLVRAADINIIDMEKDQDKILSDVTSGEYKYGFYSDIEMEQDPQRAE